MSSKMRLSSPRYPFPGLVPILVSTIPLRLLVSSPGLRNPRYASSRPQRYTGTILHPAHTYICTTGRQVKCTASCARPLQPPYPHRYPLYRWLSLSHRISSHHRTNASHVSTRLCRLCERGWVVGGPWDWADEYRESRRRCPLVCLEGLSTYGMATARLRQAVAQTCFMSV